MHASHGSATLAGVVPALPGAFARAPFWTQPVRAERLAALRIGYGLVLLYDLLIQYLPDLSYLYGPGTVGSLELYKDLTEAPNWHWSLFHGFDQSVVSAVSLMVWLALTAILTRRFWPRRFEPDRNSVIERRSGEESDGPLSRLWLFAGTVLVLGAWVRDAKLDRPSLLVWLLPAVMLATATLFWMCRRIAARGAATPRQTQVGRTASGTTIWLTCAALLAFGILQASPAGASWRNAVPAVLSGWGENAAFVRAGFYVLIGATLLLTLGLATKISSIVAWVLLQSFSNLCPEINSGGDRVRDLILLYLMLAPSGAAWSVDAFLRRRRGLATEQRYIAPWPLRLLFLQLMLIYFFTGLLKLFGADWWSGECLHYVLTDLTLSRWSFAQLPIPEWSLSCLTWFVLSWEVTFPLWLISRRTRLPILLSAVSLHLGTLALMELGGFEYYMLLLYVPLLPWDRWLSEEDGSAALSQSSTRRAKLLGVFVVWQFLFLVVANPLSVLNRLNEHLADVRSSAAETLAPQWIQRKGHLWQIQELAGSVVDLWAGLINQPQHWGMYHDGPHESDLPALKLVFASENSEDGAGEARVFPSDYEPANVHRYGRFGERRFRRVERGVLPYVGSLAPSTIVEDQVFLTQAIAYHVYDNKARLLAYMRQRVQQLRDRHPGLEMPAEVVLLARQYKTVPPTSGDRRIWEGPFVTPIARWRPRGEKSETLEVYNLSREKFEQSRLPWMRRGIRSPRRSY